MPVIDDDRLASLPDPVRRSLIHSGVRGSAVPETVTLSQRGRIRTSPDARWLSFRAVEDYGVADPSFTWRARLRIAGMTLGRATDSLSDGTGRMQVRLLGRFDVVDAAGPELDQGSLMRWFNETMWFPAVWATNLITWTPIDDAAAVGSVSVGDLTAEAVFRFDDRGRLVDFVADRYRGTGDEAALTRWRTPISGHRVFEGIEMPASGTAVWELPEGPFPYIEIALDDVRYGFGDG